MTTIVYVDQIKVTDRKSDTRDERETGVDSDATHSKPRQLGEFMSSHVRTDVITYKTLTHVHGGYQHRETS